MKLTLGDGRAIVMGLPEVMREKLPVKMSYWFSRTLRELQAHMQDLEKARDGLVDQFGKKGKDGKPLTKDNQYIFNDQKSFNEEYAKLMEQEIEVKYDGVTLEELEKLTGKQTCPECKKEISSQVIFKGMDIFNLGKLIKSPDGEGKT